MNMWIVLLIVMVAIVFLGIEFWQIKKDWVAEARAHKLEEYRLMQKRIVEEIENEPEMPDGEVCWEEIDQAIDRKFLHAS